MATALPTTTGGYEKKWGIENIRAGYTVVPSALIEHQRELQLDTIDFNIVMHLCFRWWAAESTIRPSKQSIADALDISLSTVRKRIARMEANGYIKRRARKHKNNPKLNLPNEYQLDGLVAALRKISVRTLAGKAAVAPKVPGKKSLYKVVKAS